MRNRLKVVKITKNARRDWDEQYDLFVEYVNDIIQTPILEIKNLSFEQFYRNFYNIFYQCRREQVDIFKKKCLDFLKDRCVYLGYPILVVLNDVLLYYTRTYKEAALWFDKTLRFAKKRCRTLMEHSLNKVINDENLSKHLDKGLRESIEFRINKYYFV